MNSKPLTVSHSIVLSQTLPMVLMFSHSIVLNGLTVQVGICAIFTKRTVCPGLCVYKRTVRTVSTLWWLVVWVAVEM